MNQHILEAFEYNQHLVAYLNIVNYWKSHKAEGDVERHHIVPRSFFKHADLPVDDSEDNIVTLPYEDHQKIHSLAVLCAREIIKASMKHANNMMNRKSMAGENNPNYGKPQSEERRKKTSDALKGRIISEEAKQKNSESHKGSKNSMFGKTRTHSEETKQKMSNSHKGIVKSEDWIRKIAEARKGKSTKPKSEEARKKISEAIKARWAARKAKQA